jgi:hypothetical protein
LQEADDARAIDLLCGNGGCFGHALSAPISNKAPAAAPGASDGGAFHGAACDAVTGRSKLVLEPDDIEGISVTVAASRHVAPLVLAVFMGDFTSGERN